MEENKRQPEPNGAEPKEPREKQPSNPAAEAFFWAQALAFALAALVFVNTFFFRLSAVHGESMCDTLYPGNQLILQVAGYDQPRRGDIVVCTSDAFDGEALVKRVIAVAGDTVDISPQGYMVVNGEELYEPYAAEPIRAEKRGDQSYPLTVEAGHIFVVGDNRNHSSDSRTMMVGQIAQKRVIGRALFRIWPLTQIGRVQ